MNDRVREGKLARAQMFYFDAAAVASFLARAEGSGRVPFACRRDVLGADERARQQELRKMLRPAIVARRERPDGYAFDLGSDAATLVAAAEWISLERRCCPFLNFSLEWCERGGTSLLLTGPPGAKAFLEEELSAHR